MASQRRPPGSFIMCLMMCSLAPFAFFSFYGMSRVQAAAPSTTPIVFSRLMAFDGTVSAASKSPMTPLGSLWKLFVYAYQSEAGRTESRYICRGSDPDEIFCCRPGESLDRDTALAKSCAPYFSPTRLSIDSKAWSKFWSEKLPHSPLWLTNLEKLKPETRIQVDELLLSLTEIRQNFATFDRIEAATVGTVLHGTATGALRTWGSRLRVKTFTWRDDQTIGSDDADKLGFKGGFAGWLSDGRAIWVSRAGHGRDAFQAELLKTIDSYDQTNSGKPTEGCVMVDYFSRYPISRIEPPVTGARSLVGATVVHFKNGNKIAFIGDGTLRAESSRNGDSLRISGKMSLAEYVGRVLDREVKAQPLEAARAFSIAIRTFLYQNSEEIEGCRQIADSSHTQRVSPQPASQASISIAKWSDGLALDRIENLRYHSDRASQNRLSWVQAKSLAEAGYSSDEILKTAYPTGQIIFGSQLEKLECRPHALGAKWIESQSKIWFRRLDREPGFERPDRLRVCLSESLARRQMSRVFARVSAQEMYVPRLQTRDDEISILHEYLHIAFRSHPRGRDEKYIENLARLILEEK